MLFSNLLKILILISTLVVLHFPIYANAQIDERIPVCGILVGSAEEWAAITPSVSMTGQASFAESYFVKRALNFNCASQLRQTIKFVEEPNRSYWAPDKLALLPTGRAVPDTIDPINGDQQFVHLSVDAPGTTSFAPCYPGANTNPTTLCPASYYTGGTQAGIMLHRSRNKDTGSFESSSWVVSRTSSNPPFVLRQAGTCATPQTGCRYEIKFLEKGDGTFSLDRDVQVLIQIPILLASTPDGNGEAYNSTMVIPLLIKHTAKPIPNSTPTPGGSAATPTPQPTSTPSGTGSGDGVAVPADAAAAKVALDSLKKLIAGVGKGEVGPSATFTGTLSAILKTPGLTTKQLKALGKVNKALEKFKTFIAAGATGKKAKTKKKALQTALKDNLKNAATGLKAKK